MFDVTLRAEEPNISVTLAPASAWPVIDAVCSFALMMLSWATVATVGRVGAIVSTVIWRVTVDETLPAASVAFTVSVSAPSPIAVTSAGVSV